MTNTIPNVPRELLERCAQYTPTLEKQEGRARALSELRALLSAPSPAGVDGLKRYEVFPYLDDEVAELDICESDDGSFVKYDAAQAIIDGLRGEVEEWTLRSQYNADTAQDVASERDQQAQRIGELEGLLREVHDTYRAAIHWEDLRGTMKRIDAAMSAGKDSDQ